MGRANLEHSSDMQRWEYMTFDLLERKLDVGIAAAMNQFKMQLAQAWQERPA